MHSIKGRSTTFVTPPTAPHVITMLTAGSPVDPAAAAGDDDLTGFRSLSSYQGFATADDVSAQEESALLGRSVSAENTFEGFGNDFDALLAESESTATATDPSVPSSESASACAGDDALDATPGPVTPPSHQLTAAAWKGQCTHSRVSPRPQLARVVICMVWYGTV